MEKLCAALSVLREGMEGHTLLHFLSVTERDRRWRTERDGDLLKGEMSRNRFAFFFVSLQIKFKYPHREREVSANVCEWESGHGFLRGHCNFLQHETCCLCHFSGCHCPCFYGRVCDWHARASVCARVCVCGGLYLPINPGHHHPHPSFGTDSCSCLS